MGSQDGRIQWVRDISDARLRAVPMIPTGYVVAPDPPAVCDIAGVLHSVQAGLTGDETEILDSLNFLDDMLITAECVADLPNRRCLDVLVGRLTEGEPIARAVAEAGGERLVIETLLAAIGLLFVWSSFRCCEESGEIKWAAAPLEV